MSVVVNIKRISNQEYEFGNSTPDGIRSVIKALTFDNPDPYAYSPFIEKFNRRTLTFPVGMLRTLKDALDSAEIPYKVQDYEWSLPEGAVIDCRMTGKYDFQARAVEAFYKRRWGIIVVPTRGGKTFIAGEILRVFLQYYEGNALFLVDNITLFEQAKNDFKRFFEPYGGIDIGEICAGKIDLTHRLTVGMVQTIQSALKGKNTQKARLKRRTLERYLRELRFLAVDEIHENCSDTRLRLYKRCRMLDFQLCLSATPYRSGTFGQNLKLMAWSGDIVYQIEEDTLRQRGVLSDYQVFVFFIDHNNSGVRVNDWDYGDCRQKLILDNGLRNGVLKRAVRLFTGLGLKTLVLFQSIDHGRAFSAATGIPFISGETPGPERERVKSVFLTQGGGALAASNIFKKGVTLPEVEVLINADGGLEDANTVQRKGRTLGATESKKRSLVVDFFDLYDAYLSTHSEARLNTYVDALGEGGVRIVDVAVPDWSDVIECWTRQWFNL